MNLIIWREFYLRKELTLDKSIMSNKRNNQPLKIVFFGAPHFSGEILKFLIGNNFSPQLVITHPDQPVGRKKILTPTESKKIALENNISIKEFSSLGVEEIKYFQTYSPDLIITASYGLIIPLEIINSAKLGALNIHPSLLPKLRGATPIQTALRQGLEKTGSTIMLMDAGMDTGDIISQEQLLIDRQDTYPVLEQKLIDLSTKLLLPVLEDIKKTGKKPTGKKQDNSQATFTKLIEKQDGLIDWHQSAREIYNQWRAFYDWPKIYTFYKQQKLTLTEIEIPPQNDIMSNENASNPGDVFRNKNKDILVQTGNGQIKINKLQLAGKQELNILDFVNGQPQFIGTNLSK